MNRLKSLYYPADDDEQILMLSDRRPCQAVVTGEHADKADLLVTDHFGNQFVRLAVPFSRTSRQCDLCVMV